LQFFARETNTPTFLISAMERDASRAEEVAVAIRRITRPLVRVVPTIVRRAAAVATLNYAPCPEVFAPLVAPIPVMLFASYRAELLGEAYFRAFGGGRSIEHGGGISRIRTSEIVV
jgi:glucosamine--fructose-6-phosphate aminotransferase (isomerizing)